MDLGDGVLMAESFPEWDVVPVEPERTPQLSGYVNLSLCRGASARLSLEWVVFTEMQEEERSQLSRLNLDVMRFVSHLARADDSSKVID